MLVRNLTKTTIRLGYGVDRVTLPPMKVVNVDSCKYSAEYIKKHYGHYIQILIEKVEEQANEAEVLADDKADMDEKGATEELQAPGDADNGADAEEEAPDNADCADGGNGEDNNTDAGEDNKADGDTPADDNKEDEEASEQPEDETKEDGEAEATEETVKTEAKKAGRKPGKKAKKN